jgi:glycerol-3-phosphate acyltransferase PlsY
MRLADMVVYVVVIVLAYLLGSLPTGYLAGKARGIDIRAVGSGNIGATNVFRILGRKAGTIVLAVDALKGFSACRLIAPGVLRFFSTNSGSGSLPSLENLMIAAGVATILGHNYTLWLRFKGGKGIATTGGVLLAWAPVALLVSLGVWFVVFFTSKYVSLASIVAAISMPCAVWAFGASPPLIIISAMLGALAVYKHRTNIRRLLNGTENRAGSGKARPPS